MNYSEFLFSQLYSNKFGEDLSYDEMFADCKHEYTRFIDSEFNDSSKGLYECIEEYFENLSNN